MYDDEGRLPVLLLILLVLSAFFSTPFIYSELTTSKQWTGEREVAGFTIEVTRWKKVDPPKGWVLVTSESELVSLMKEVKPDSLARFETGYGTFYMMDSWGEVIKEERPLSDPPGKNDFQIWKRVPPVFDSLIHH